MNLKPSREEVKILILGIILNLVGRALALRTGYPGFLNVTGTIYGAYYGGACIGAIVAISSGLISTIFVHKDIYYLFMEFVFAIIVALLSRNNKYLNRFFSVQSLTLTFTLVRSIMMTIVNMAFFDGKTGLFLPDATMDFLNSLNLPFLGQSFIASVYICFADNFLGLFSIYIVRLNIKGYTKKKTALKLKKALGQKATLVLAIMLTALSFPLETKASGMSIENHVARIYNSENGLVGGCANDVAQTADGSIWVGTYGGLYRFNGTNFQLVNLFQTVRSIQSLYVDENDNLWVGTNGAGVTVIDDNLHAYNFDTSRGLVSNTVSNIVEDNDLKFYIATTGGVCYVTMENGKIFLYKKYEEIGNVLSMQRDSAGRVAALNAKGEVTVFSSGEIVARIPGEDAGASCVAYDKEDNLYIGTDHECIHKYELVDNHYVKIEEITAQDLIFINNIYFKDNGYAYIAADSGIGIMDSDMNVTVLNPGNFDSAVEEIYEDYQGNLWFTSYRRGLLCMSKSSFIDMFSICNQPASVANVTYLQDNCLYVGTDDGLVILDLDSLVSIKNEATDYFDSTRVRSMTKDAEGNLVIAGYGKEIMGISPTGEFFNYIEGKQITDRRARLVYALSNGEIVISAETGLYFIKDRKIDCVMRLDEELKSSSILNILELPDGTLLLGSDGDGVEIVKNHKLENVITKKDGLSAGVILRLVRDRRGNGIYVVTGSGLCYLTEDNQIKELTGIPFYNNYDIYQTPQGNSFIMGGAGIYVAKYDVLMESNDADSFDLLDVKSGLPGSLTSNAWNCVDENGNMYLCGSTGVYKLNLNNYDIIVDKYKSKITGVDLDGNSYSVTNSDEIVIPRGVKRVTFTLDLNNFTPTDPYVRYYLYGVDQEKTKVLSSNISPISYFLIPYGTYEFHVEVLDDDNRVIDENVYTITKEREVYETLGFRVYFYIILILLVNFIIASIINGAVYILTKRQKTEHEQIVRKLQVEKTQALEKALRTEEDANKMKSAFLANMSHEIRTPINAIIGMGTMISRESKEDETKKYARDIRNASKTLLALINDILDFSKIESGNLELVMGEYDLGILVNDLVNMIQPKATDKRLDFIVEVDPNIPKRLYGDDVRIEQIIINILNNAVKYTNVGSVKFVMDYEKVSEDQIELKVSISDTGIGIKEEDIEKLFSPYQRIEEFRNKKVEGTGLGMSITKSLLDKMNSSLQVSSIYGKGSTFSFSIIQSVCGTDTIGDFRDNNDFEDRENKVEKFHAKNAVILVVDDVDMNLIVAKNLLKRIQIEVDTASSGRDAIELAKIRKYDIIFMDAMMPGMSGEEAMQGIKKECTINADTPIIVLTANAIKGAKEEYIDAGFDDYLSKPIDGIQFEDMIEKHLPEEKIAPVTESDIAAMEAESHAVNSVIDLFRNEPFIDVNKGIEATGDEDTYLIVCKSFYDTALDKINLIRKYQESGDIKNYTIQVHALKSSARLIGALDLSEKALVLEMAGKEGNIDLINTNTPETLFIYKYVYDRLDSFYNAGEASASATSDKEPISEEEVTEAYSVLKELVEQMDFDGASDVIETLKEYALSTEDEEKVSKLGSALQIFDWDAMEEILG
ncbi:Signal transduction histidine kinase [Pseudobutyrivibrio sp. OR37]|uniref:hybrid sensor histidine kinase/response regulator n=1 Tax=Pseudobutyrivibrio sp. OR37 TaxID=1798186 RepID=UPI0008E37B43|nr:ATP-binding protein [Pseudobutyrivibrio sp. OR37]SFH69070.1 Signal transduction histidine kinase [Pseudobutyrivibrio sp. OR37]